MELLLIGCLVEIQVAATELVTALACQQNFDIGVFGDPFGNEVETGTCSNRRNVKCLTHFYYNVQLI